MSESPSTTGGNGQRGPHGRFAPGNRLAVGNPHARRVAKLRSALLRAVTLADMRAIVAKLVADAKAGNVQAAKEILERTLGRPPQPLDITAEVETTEKGPDCIDLRKASFEELDWLQKLRDELRTRGGRGE